MKIDIHYCGQWNYKPRALSLREELNEHYKDTFDKFEINLVLILYLLNKFLEILVSSHNIKSDFLNVSNALKVISFKLPIGVGTKYKPFLNSLFVVLEFTIIFVYK